MRLMIASSSVKFLRTPRDRHHRQAGRYAARGDQAGSDASVGVATTRSLNPVMSIETRSEPYPLPLRSRAGLSRKNISTRPFGQKVGPSTEKLSERMRS